MKAAPPSPWRSDAICGKYTIRHVLDFSNWQDSNFFDRQFTKLLEGLRVFYGEGK